MARLPGQVKQSDGGLAELVGSHDYFPSTGAPLNVPRPKLMKRSDYDDPFAGDGTKLMPALRAIHKTGSVKIAEPPPPKGIPVKKWDKLLAGKVKHAEDRPVAETEFQGLKIGIENPKGSVRSGVDKDGHEWHTKMKLPYGFIDGTKAPDGDSVDAFVGPDKEAPKAFVVHQKTPDGKKYDEDKVFLGLHSKKEAKEAFLMHNDNPRALGDIAEVSMERLQQLTERKGELSKISQVSYWSMLEEICKLSGIKGQMEQGAKVEQEHEGTIEYLKREPNMPVGKVERLIASDHLREIPDYYTRLKKMEAGAEKQAAISSFVTKALTSKPFKSLLASKPGQAFSKKFVTTAATDPTKAIKYMGTVGGGLGGAAVGAVGGAAYGGLTAEKGQGLSGALKGAVGGAALGGVGGALGGRHLAGSAVAKNPALGTWTKQQSQNALGSVWASKTPGTVGRAANATAGRVGQVRPFSGSVPPAPPPAAGVTGPTPPVGAGSTIKQGSVKLAWSWEGFKEGLGDEGVPLSGATIGAGLGAIKGKGLTGAALGYAVGSGASIARSKLKGEEPTTARKLLALSGLGYGLGGLGHAGVEHLTRKIKPGTLKQVFHGTGGLKGVTKGMGAEAVGKLPGAKKAKFLQGLAEEGLPATGATLGAATAMATSKEHQPGHVTPPTMRGAPVA